MHRIYNESQEFKTTAYGNPKHFWSWFKDNHHMTINQPSLYALKEFMDWFGVHLDYYCNSIHYEVSFSNKYNEFIFSARGNPDHFEAVTTLVDAAPKLPNTKIIAFFQKKITDTDIITGKSKIETGSFSLSHKQLRFTMDYTDPITQRKGMTIYHESFDRIQNKTSFSNHIMFFLIDYLGEFELFNKIAWIDIEQLHLKEVTKPILELKKSLDIKD